MEMMQEAGQRKQTAMAELVSLMRECSDLDAEIRFNAKNLCFTVMVWRGWDSPDPKSNAKEIQMQVKAMSEQYPHVVCYCFDDHSTLLYVIC